MTSPGDQPAGEATLSPVKRALVEIRALRAELEAAREPLAVVGLGVRLPGGVVDASALADLLWRGGEAVGPIPADRWPLDRFLDDDPDAPGKMTTRSGAFLDAVDRLDAEFFGISPREAESLDPQQLLVLEVAWHALEDAGCAPSAIAGSRTGVFLGACNSDHGRALFARRDAIDAWFSTGNALSTAAGRVAYALDLRGPAVSVDTACSSSLVALHLAGQALRARECDRALVGGVNLVLGPEMNIAFSKARMMAKDGRCKAFDAAADGYVRGEGCVFVVVRRLSDAVESGERVLAVVRGTAVNQDGRSGGLTVPSGPAQEAVLRAALAAAGVAPAEVAYVEAHGTGTALGDPIEAGALAAVFGPGRPAGQPLLLGSIKTNLGHLEAAAGLAGLAKVVLALRRRELPPSLHFRAGNPHIDWSAPLEVVTSVRPFPALGRRLAGVSSFGFSGTNAHVVLEEAPEAPPATATASRPLHVLPLSARDGEGLRALAARWETALEGPTAAGDLCFTAALGRAELDHRLAVSGADAGALRRGLRGFLAGEPGPEVATGRVEGAARPQVAFLFTGQGAQRAGTGRALHEAEPVVREVLDRCDAALGDRLGVRLLEAMFAPPGRSRIDETAFAQPATFALEVALAALWRSWGVEPSALLGHSLGGFAAACVAGVLGLEDGVRLVAERGRLAGALPGAGAMGAVFAPLERVVDEVARTGGAVVVAASNGPAHQVVSGPREAVGTLLARLEASGLRVKLLRVPHAAHSPLVEPMLGDFERALRAVPFAPARLPVVSDLTGALAGPGDLERPAYWLAHLRERVRFAEAMQTLSAQGIGHFVEVGPHPVLLGMGAEGLPGPERTWLPSLHRDRPEGLDLAESLQRLWAAGTSVDWAAYHRGRGGRRVAAPLYPFSRRRARPLPSAEPPAPGAAARFGAVSRALDLAADRGPLDLDLRSYPAAWDALARLTDGHARAFLAGAGLFARAGERRTLAEVLEAAGVAGTYRHLVGRWLVRLAAAGALRAEGEAFTAPAPLAAPALAPLWDAAARTLAGNPQLLAYLRRCGALLPRVLTGRESPLETLFPGGDFTLAEDLYERSATMRYANGLAAAALAACAAAAGGRALRVMEVGAGTGGTTSALLAALGDGGYEYLFTDVSDAFLDRARSRFAGRPGVRYGRFDLDAPAAGDPAPGSLDVVVAANAVHATRDLRAALARLRALLAPGGLLLLVESTAHLDWFDMSTGLVEGWQHFADDLRGDHPLLSPERWVSALTQAGFAEAGAWPRADSPAAALAQHVVAARAPGEGARAEAGVAAPDAGASAATAAQAGEASATALRDRVLAAAGGERAELVRDHVRRCVMRVLRRAEDDPPDRRARLMDLGLDSLMAVQLRNLLGAGLALARPLPATVMFDCPTVDALTAHLLAELGGAESPPAIPDAGSAPAADAARARVAAMSEAEVEALLLERLGDT